MERPVHILPSILAAPIGRLEQGCRQAAAAGADGLHVDIMDAHFVPNLSMGPDVVRMAKQAVDVYLSVHLMMTHPNEYVDVFTRAGADILLIHIEADCDVPRTLRCIRDAGIRAGITLNPETPADSIFGVLDADLVDEVLCMTVHPGFGGQSFIPEVLPKIDAIHCHAPNVWISVDGGVINSTGADAAGQGANVFVAGSFLFRANDMAAAVRDLRAGCAAALEQKEVKPT